LGNKSTSENTVGSYAIVKLWRKYVTMHGAQNVKKELCNSPCSESQTLLLIELHFITSKIS